MDKETRELLQKVLEKLENIEKRMDQMDEQLKRMESRTEKMSEQMERIQHDVSVSAMGIGAGNML